MERRIGIVGAGVSGLLACKYVLSKGYQPLVLESQPELGGVWTKTIETTRLQSPKCWYVFSDYPWPSSIETQFPTQNQVLDYIKSYATHFDLIKYIKFNTKVLSIKYEGPSDDEMESWTLWSGNGEPFGNKAKWTLTVQDIVSLSTQVMEVDFVILCMGKYSGIPNMPEFGVGEGAEVFKGKVIHSMEYANMDNQSAHQLIKGKRVTIVGFQKSALEIAMESSSANGIDHPCTMIYKAPRWNIPDYHPYGFSLAKLYFNRFSELLVHKPGDTLFCFLLVYLLFPLRWLIGKLVESDIKKKHNLKKFNMIPHDSFLQEIDSCMISLVPNGFYDNVEKGNIYLKRSQTFKFCKEGVLLGDTGEVIESDLVILATGYKGDLKLKYIFDSSKFQHSIIDSSHQCVSLYRQTIHPRIPQLAVLGFSTSLANIYTTEIRCRWVAEVLDGKFKLPDIEGMMKDVLEVDKFMVKYYGNYYKNSCVRGLHIWYNDQLCKDMGWNPMRKKSFWAELFEPYGPMDYVSP